MKDYTFNNEDKKDFILNYEAKDKRMFIHLGSGVTLNVPYTRKNETKVIQKMEKQVMAGQKFYFGTKEGKAIKDQLLTKLCFAVLLSTVSYIFMRIDSLGAVWNYALAFCFAGSAVFLGVSGVEYVRHLIMIRDLRKNVEFLNMKDRINGKIKESDSEVLDNYLAKTGQSIREVVAKAPRDREEILNINSFNYVPFSDLKQIDENIAVIEELGLDDGTNRVESKVRNNPKRKVKKL